MKKQNVIHNVIEPINQRVKDLRKSLNMTQMDFQKAYSYHQVKSLALRQEDVL